MQSGDRWFVKNEDGRVFGPCGADTLAQWAREGRIAPSACVSNGGDKWVQAPLVPELGMDCIVEIGPRQFFGPVHPEAVDDLVRNGGVSPDARRFRLAGHADAETARLAESEAAARAEAERLAKSEAVANAEVA